MTSKIPLDVLRHTLRTKHSEYQLIKKLYNEELRSNFQLDKSEITPKIPNKITYSTIVDYSLKTENNDIFLL